MSFPFYSLSVEMQNSTAVIPGANFVIAPAKPALATDAAFVLPISIPRIVLPRPRSDGMFAIQFHGIGFDGEVTPPPAGGKANFLRFDFYNNFPGFPPLGFPGLWTDYLDFNLTPMGSPWSSGRQYVPTPISFFGLQLFTYASFQNVNNFAINPGLRNMSLTVWGADDTDQLPPLIPPTPEP